MNKSSSWGLIEREGKFLFIKRSVQTSRAGQWCPPGGGRKDNESPEEACIREVKEEVGLDVTVKKLIRKDDSFYYFLCSEESELQVNLKENECCDFQWISIESVLELGLIMEFKRMQRVFNDMGYLIE